MTLAAAQLLVNVLAGYAGADGGRRRVWPEAYREAPKGRILGKGWFWWWPIPVSVIAAIGLWFVFWRAQDAKIGEMMAAEGGAPAAPREAPK